MPKLWTKHKTDESIESVAFLCPGCGCGHMVHIAPERNPHTGASWTWNGDMERPTFNPSVLLASGSPRCHSFVRNGQIEFLSDCTHTLAGQIVPLPDV